LSGGLTNQLICLAIDLSDFPAVLDFDNAPQISFASFDILITQAPSAVVAGRATQRDKLAMTKRTSSKIE